MTPSADRNDVNEVADVRTREEIIKTNRIEDITKNNSNIVYVPHLILEKTSEYSVGVIVVVSCDWETKHYVQYCTKNFEKKGTNHSRLGEAKIPKISSTSLRGLTSNLFLPPPITHHNRSFPKLLNEC